MCDTLGFLKNGNVYFAKNSDRSPNEPQVMEFYPAQSGLSGEVQLTYISIPQVEKTNAILLSRPTWMWGGEIGMNEHGVIIGNEALFTKGPYGSEALLGMDLLRLGLERADTAKGALEVIISLLEQYGQGGNCGFDAQFFYDNAFLIMDWKNLYVLETCGKAWVWKKSDAASISNIITIEDDGDVYSGGEKYNFKERFLDPEETAALFGGLRRQQTLRCSMGGSGVADCMAALRGHYDESANPFAEGTGKSPCMHFGGESTCQSTASMVVQQGKGRSVVWSTGTSTPCVSLFKPWLLGTEPVTPIFYGGDSAAKAYWLKTEAFRRGLLGKKVPDEFYAQLHAIQNAWLAKAETLSDEEFPAFSRACAEEEERFYAQWNVAEFEDAPMDEAFVAGWAVKNEALEQL